MVNLGNLLVIERCPHCNIDQPNMAILSGPFESRDYEDGRPRFWKIYRCVRCGGAVLACSGKDGGVVREQYPASTDVDENIPEPARDYLRQALNSLHAPAGSVMLCASAVDAMLKSKGYTKGSLFSRIDQAKDDHLITEEMALWAHEIRLDANDPRHADEEEPLPSEEDAQKCVEFTLALAQFMFVLPARVERGRGKKNGGEELDNAVEP